MAAQHSIMETLPYDILGLIFDMVKEMDFASLCALRFTSKVLNEAVESKTFISTTIGFSNRPWTSAQLETMASGTSPHSLWTRNLTILQNGLIPLEISGYDCFQGEVRERFLVCQKTFLVPALKSLHELVCAKVALTGNEPYCDILQALAELSNLAELTISPCITPEEYPLPLDTFANLRVIAISCFPIFPSIVVSLKRMLAQSAESLESLTLVPNDWNTSNLNQPRSINLDELFEEPPGSLRVCSNLKELVINGNRIRLSALSAPILQSLTRLEVRNCANDNIDPTFWDALQDAKVHLRALTMSPITPRAVEYLASYTGLKELCMKAATYSHKTQSGAADPLSVLESVLPKHRETLQVLSFAALGFTEFMCAEETVDAIIMCEQLKSLELVYHYRELQSAVQDDRTLKLERLLFRLTDRLPHLARLHIAPKRLMPRMRCGNGAMSYYRRMSDSFVKDICEVQFVARSPRFTVEAGRSCTLVFDHEARCFAAKGD
ncbi:hypothetical protein DFP72DRAFT_892430 [Ephemerocybe angulata]|uniref:F-box domain-containing protein n=1 Tax=Ephemerocybe angulata TaxID=980116 RepID=A0A8H6I3L9_9AGAR|nr:hypothetical protein DFP72DRAFT_892430 [Tulosesus angulatus]